MNQTKVGADGAGSGATISSSEDGAVANPSYLGIKDADKNTYRDTLQRFAAVDFWHDFHHVKTTPILDRLGKSYNVNSGLPVREYQSRVLTLRGAYQGKTLYDRFESDPTNVMLLGSNAKSVITAKSEDDVLDSLLPDGTKYQSIRQKLVVNNFTSLEGVQIGLSSSQHIYKITATEAKVDDTYSYIAPAFTKVSSGTKNFILMIDASFLAMSKIFELANDDTNSYNFFIIQSVENEGDPATKIGKFDASQNPKVNVYFLKDTGHKTFYTPYEGGNGDNSNLFSDCSISAYRDSDNLITADIQSDGINTTIENIGTASEPNEAGFLAFQRLITKGNTNKDEAFVYYLLKRAGDWCQALCLLDRGRQYTVTKWNQNEKQTSDTVGAGSGPTIQSINDIIREKKNKGESVEVALLTHDKILLSYALLLGLNVFYTIKTVSTAASTSGSGAVFGSSVTWLTYFKNTLDADPNAIINAANQKLENIQNDIKKIVLILNNSTNDITTINFDGIDRNALDSRISRLYESIPSMVLNKINETKTFENDGSYKGGFLTDFLSTTRVVLDLASKIAAKPSTFISVVYSEAAAAAATAAVVNNKNSDIFFSKASAAETTVHTYLQIVQFIQKLVNLTDSEIQTILQEEYTKIKELEEILQSDKPIVLANKAHVEPYQYFLFTTLPAIQKDYKTFQSLFPVVPGAAVGAGQGAGPNIKDALTLEIDKYKIKDRPVPRQRTLDLWENKIGLWYQEYSEGINSTSTTQGGGGIQTGGGTIEELFSKKWIKTREAPQGEEYANIQNIISSLRKKYELDTSWEIYLKTKANNIYQNKINTGINQYEIYSFIEDVLNLTLINYLDNVTSNGFFDNSMNAALVLFSDLYTKENTTIDIGTTITYNDGLGYTLLDNCILTKEDEGEISNLLEGSNSSKSTTSTTVSTPENEMNMTKLYYRNELLKLDNFTNDVHSIGMIIEDVDKNGKSHEPYYSDDHILYLERMIEELDLMSYTLYKAEQATASAASTTASAASTTASAASAASTTSSAASAAPTKYKHSLFAAPTTSSAASAAATIPTKSSLFTAFTKKQNLKDTILIEIAVLKVRLINLFLLSTGSNIDDYQKVQLYYLLCPSIKDTADYFAELQELFKEDNEHLEKAEEKVREEARVAKAASPAAGKPAKTVSRKKNKFGAKKGAVARASRRHALAAHTERNKFIMALQGRQQTKKYEGGKRYTKTRSKPKMRKDTRKRNKKYRSKTRRIHKI